MTMTTLSPMDRLAKLAAQRTARTDRLSEATRQLLCELDKVTEIGDAAFVEGFWLERCSGHSNVAPYEYWAFSCPPGLDDEGRMWCALDAGVGVDSYWHGDLTSHKHGPSRRELLAFATRAAKFVAQFVAKIEQENAKLERASASIAAAVEQAKSI
jgi:hypothetical protein